VVGIILFPLQLFKRLRKQGYCLVAVSQSPFVVLKHYCNAIDGDSFDLVSSPLPTIIENNGIQYLGRHSVVSPDERDKYTAVTLLAKCYGFDLSKSIAIGDSLNDAPMMRAVSGQKIAYNPKDDLRAVAESENWDVIIEVENLNEEEKRE
jgi:phosphoserine phosphatase